MDAVSEVLVERNRELAGIQRMVAASITVHVAIMALVAIAPFGTSTPSEPPVVMTISLGGPPGPRAGGLTTMGGRPVQTEAVEARKAIEPVRPPAAREPEMIEPKKVAPKKNESKVQRDVKDARGRTPTKGDEVRSGSAVAETGGRGLGFGLTQGGGGTGGTLDVADFCCPEYLSTMLDLINQRWDSKQQTSGTTIVKFVIQRDGTLTGIELERSSGNGGLDLFARRALLLTAKLPPLPAAFTEPSLTVHMRFDYQR